MSASRQPPNCGNAQFRNFSTPCMGSHEIGPCSHPRHNAKTGKHDPPPVPAAWVIEQGVRCVVCPTCAFTFDAIHTLPDGSYSCPLCDVGGAA